MNPERPFLPYGRQTIEADDVEAVSQVLLGDWLTGGPSVTAFEQALAAQVEAPHAVACANGTAALHLAMLALGIGPGDAVIVPTLTFLATANAARFVGAEVIFADVDPHTGLLGDATFAQALQRAGERPVRAVIPVHLNGQLCPELAQIAQRAKALGIAVVEDACHALGSRHHGPQGYLAGACRHSEMTVFSFHPVKTIAMGEGGAITTHNPQLAERLQSYRNHGMSRDPEHFTQPHEARDAQGELNPWYYEMTEPGFNYRASDLHCALGLSQLHKLGRFVAARQQLATLYHHKLAALAPILTPIPMVEGADPALHLFAVWIDFEQLGMSRGALMQALKAKGIGTQVHYLPVHRQPYYRRLGSIDLPGADAYYQGCLSLPFYPSLQEGDLDRVVQALAELWP
ncbi:DegT/DnrJ/EryC1/StrS aminotransferase [Magnetococcus marinus MC-1]|uniref:DegT/DnrJ/EryC1/StrS aminotransferase n=1 Tax=Magnetococcus marinus (strain ATCC BAA-1437 / JCM 17883 / MC-1) TaxID=156889 RepID=A0LAB7_MAGMM|nr:UDP-4-amino-4,6-dideoxy-N-acetyl-beta-L-altrosamine transaminase [Magnetococcus marinus]ABK44910.1 DegT/DnrJ/EryC1/StrS aminotransferase [Magnetococcus marinus MC-1]